MALCGWRSGAGAFDFCRHDHRDHWRHWVSRGRKVIDLAIRRGHEIVAFTRTPERAISGCTTRKFSLEAPPDISGCEALIHLAAESPMGVWTASKKQRIVETR